MTRMEKLLMRFPAFQKLEEVAVVADTSGLHAGDVVISNMCHYEALCKAHEALEHTRTSLEANYPTDLVSEDVRNILHHLGEITGDITSDDILQSIFSKFCIGK